MGWGYVVYPSFVDPNLMESCQRIVPELLWRHGHPAVAIEIDIGACRCSMEKIIPAPYVVLSNNNACTDDDDDGGVWE